MTARKQGRNRKGLGLQRHLSNDLRSTITPFRKVLPSPNSVTRLANTALAHEPLRDPSVPNYSSMAWGSDRGIHAALSGVFSGVFATRNLLLFFF